MQTKRILLRNAEVYLENEIISKGYVLIENGKITDAGSSSSMPEITDAKVIDLEEGSKIIPGFIDVHIHGVGGADTMDATPDAIRTMAAHLPAEGTTSFLATTITQAKNEIHNALENVAQYRSKWNEAGEAEVLGAHLEGPFINPAKKGAQPEEHILNPDIELFKEWQKVSNNSIKLVTLAPEQPNGMEFVKYLHDTNVVASLGHTDATYKQVEIAVKAGATQVTHLYNGMRGLHHREPGVAGAALLLKELKTEIISDGIHVHPEMIKLAVNAKGKDGVILITDSMRAKCLKAGKYDLGGQEVTVANGQALLADGTLAGSILRMIDSVKNMLTFTDLTLLDLIHLASINPAKQLQVFDRKGSIAAGKDADIVILNSDMEITMTFCRGKIGYEA